MTDLETIALLHWHFDSKSSSSKFLPERIQHWSLLFKAVKSFSYYFFFLKQSFLSLFFIDFY